MIGRLDWSSWTSLLSTLFAVALIAVIGVGIRLVGMMTIQQRRERINRQINERLRTLIAAYKTLGGSFTGDLHVDPVHLRELRGRGEEGSDRARRIRDAVEGALSDIILLGTAEHVRMAGAAAQAMRDGRTVELHALVVSLRDFIRDALDLDPVPADTPIPPQGPARPAPSSRSGAREPGARGGGGGMGGGGEGMAMGGLRPHHDEA